MKVRAQAQGSTEQAQDRVRTGTWNFEAMQKREVLGQVMKVRKQAKGRVRTGIWNCEAMHIAQ
jgi:hypothetical protein